MSKKLTTEQKCQEILLDIVEMCRVGKVQEPLAFSISFCADFSANSLTIKTPASHSHLNEDSFTNLIDHLHKDIKHQSKLLNKRWNK